MLADLAVAGCGGTTTYVREPVSPAAAATSTTAAPAASTPAPSTSTAPAAPTAAPAPTLTNPSAVVTQFYQDITNGDYSAAWALGGENLTGGQTYAQWVAGYQDTTASISVITASNWNSSTAYADIDATQLDGTEKTYAGTYDLVGGVIQSANIKETS